MKPIVFKTAELLRADAYEAFRAYAGQDTWYVRQVLHQEEMEELKKMAVAVAPRAAQELIVKNLSRTIS